MDQEKLTFSLGADDVVTVEGWDSLIRWLESERAQWAWLVRGDGLTDVRNVATAVQNQWDGLINAVNTMRNQGEGVQKASGHLQPFASGLLLASQTANGVQVLEIRETAGNVAGSFAYGFINGTVNLRQAHTRDELLGAILTVTPDIRKPVEFSERLQRERANYRSSIRSAIERLDQANAERDAAFQTTLGRGKSIAAKMLRRRRDSWRTVQDNWQQSALAAVTSIRSVEAAYLEAMHLQAPVKYWSDKAAVHRTKEFWGIGRLAIFFPLALGGLGWAFWESGTYLLNHATSTAAQVPPALYIIITGGLVVLTTLLFWIGRLFTKLYLSEHHLRNDADERAIMAQTYLALTKEAAATDADRNIVLTAMFRNTPDGIVRDEGPADISIQALLSRLVTR